MRYYYVYAYLDPRKPGKFKYGDFEFDFEPFYIGKGRRYRINAHIRQAKYGSKNSLKLNKIRKILESNREPILFKVVTKLNEKQALKIEEDLIELIGRKCENKGPLSNIERGQPHLNERHQSTKDKMSQSHIGKKHSDETKKKISESRKGKSHSKKTKDKIASSRKGHKQSEETKRKIAESLRGRKQSNSTKFKISNSLRK